MKEYMFTKEELKIIGDAADILTLKQDEYPEVIRLTSQLWDLYEKDGGIKRQLSEDD